jgi:hypothetical protein
VARSAIPNPPAQSSRRISRPVRVANDQNLRNGRKIRNPKHEIRNKSKIPRFKFRNRKNDWFSIVLSIFILRFEFVSNFGFRASNFEIGALVAATPRQV